MLLNNLKLWALASWILLGFCLPNSAPCATAADTIMGHEEALPRAAALSTSEAIRIPGEEVATRGLAAITEWSVDKRHNGYGASLTLINTNVAREHFGNTSMLEEYLDRMDGSARIFQTRLYEKLRINPAFKEAAYLFKKKYPTRISLLKALGTDFCAVLTGGIAIWHVYSSLQTNSIGEKFTAATAYTVSGITEVSFALSLMRTAQDAYRIMWRGQLPAEADINSEAQKISYFLTFKKYEEIVAKKREVSLHRARSTGRETEEHAAASSMAKDYVNWVLAILAQNYTAGSHKSFLVTIIENSD